MTGASTADRVQAERDLRELTERLLAIAAGAEGVIELNRDELLRRLGWQQRFEFWAVHEFPVPKDLYEPIRETCEEVEAVLASTERGYVGLIGTPGSGKSTLLTEVLRNRPERVIRYYAFVPDSQHPRALRGEAVSFLHDVVLALERAGLQAGTGPAGLERIQLLERFQQQLIRLNADWRKTGRKTIILIDGLDHIAREQRPDRSLLRDLPDPEQVPHGVVFLLGTQTDQLPDLPDRVQHAVRQPGRRMEIRPLVREAVRRIVGRAKLRYLVSGPVHDRIYAVSGGHPLALGYLLNRLRDASDDAGAGAVLDEAVPFEGSIEAEYHSYWRSVAERDAEVAHLLGLLARLRGAIDLEWVRSWTEPSVINRLKGTGGHYFRREGKRWYFFHNSFRVFLVRKTAEGDGGDLDAEADRRLHNRLADACARSEGPHAWDELYHRAMAGAHGAVLAKATPEHFRNQLFGFRPIEAINADLDLCLRSLADERDVVLLTRLILAASEMRQRSYQLGGRTFVRELLDLGEDAIAISRLREGNTLRVGREFAMEMAVRLAAKGVRAEAERLFELAEPLDLIRGDRDVSTTGQDWFGELVSWARAAPDFGPVAEVVATIRGMQVPREDRGTAAPDARTVQGSLLVEIGLRFVKRQKWADVDVIAQAFDLSVPTDRRAWFWLNVQRCQAEREAGLSEAAGGTLETLLSAVNPQELGATSRIWLGECVYRVRRDAGFVRELIESVAVPVPDPHRYSSQDAFEPFLRIFEHRRMRRLVGDTTPAFEVAEAAGGPELRRLRWFVGSVCTIADLSAEAWRGGRFDPGGIAQRVMPLLRQKLAKQDGMDFHPATSWSVLRSTGLDLYGLLVRVVASHGFEAVDQLRADFETEWNRTEDAQLWPAPWKREIVLALRHAGVGRRWCTDWLERLEGEMLEGQDVDGRITECEKQARAWAQVGELERARRNLPKALEVSFGVGYRKDYQLDIWMDWLPEINKREPELAGGRIGWFAQVAASLVESTEGRAAMRAGLGILGMCFEWSPRRAVRLFWWLMDHHVIGFADGLTVLLRSALRSDHRAVGAVEQVLHEMVLPTAATGPAELAVEVIRSKAGIRGKESAAEAARGLVETIGIAALPSTQAEWYAGVREGARELGLEVLVPEAQERSDSDVVGSRILQRKGGLEALPEEEVIEQARSHRELLALLESEAPSSYFDWSRVLNRTIQNVGHEELLEIAQRFGEREDRAKPLAILSERASALGDVELGWRIGEEALRAAKYYGWDRMMGGEKQEIFRALIKADPGRARHQAYEDLVRTLTSEYPYPENIALNLRSIVPLLCEDPPVSEVWKEVEGYVRELFSQVTLPSIDEAGLGSDCAEDRASRAVCDVVVDCASHPVRCIAQGAHRCCAELLLRGERGMADAVQAALEAEGAGQEYLVRVLEWVGRRDAEALGALRGSAMELRRSPSFAVREAATRIGALLDETHPVQTDRVALPPAYRFGVSFGRVHLAGGDVEPRPGEPLPDTEDPWRIVRPFGERLRMIAREAGLPEDGVAVRAAEIMRGLSEPDQWSAEAERRLRGVLDSAGLKLSFVRPRTQLVRRALFRVVAELADAGFLGQGELMRLDRELRYYDPAMLGHRPAGRPPEVPLLKTEGRLGGVARDFMISLRDPSDAAIARRVGDRVVLAECTYVQSLDWTMETEVRRSIAVRGRDRSMAEEPRERFFPTVNQAYESEYAGLNLHQEPPALVIQNAGVQLDSPGAQWLAFNPELARRLGWQISSTGLFRWADRGGAPMVETVWWMDGGFRRAPPHPRDQVACGWLVAASPVAWGAITDTIGDQFRVVFVERRIKQKPDEPRIHLTFAEPMTG